MSFNRPVQRQPAPGANFYRQTAYPSGDYECGVGDDVVLATGGGSTIKLCRVPQETAVDIFCRGVSGITVDGNGNTIAGLPTIHIDEEDMGHFLWDALVQGAHRWEHGPRPGKRLR